MIGGTSAICSAAGYPAFLSSVSKIFSTRGLWGGGPARGSARSGPGTADHKPNGTRARTFGNTEMPTGALRNSTAIQLSRIATAPIKQGEHFGPCLLGPGYEEDWSIGRWNGSGWFDVDGFALAPALWAPLPPLSRALDSELYGLDRSKRLMIADTISEGSSTAGVVRLESSET